MRTIITLPKADTDFLRIYEHYAYERGVPDVAAYIDLEIRNAIEKFLTDFPGIGKPFKIGGITLRGLLVMDSHWAMYSYDDEFVYIHHIIASREFRL
ncbi:MAG: type II toxin-antitoxin system RelE/ParE family toxin [Robiginitomaculum sp.]|nr:type II toxin-antitoxin system RelE/ParE family toxin [Robiginitomaculum sp.]